MSIQYFSEDTPFELKNQTQLTAWIELVVHTHKHTIESISYVFCSDDYLLEVNRTHLNHDYYTDIITFDNSDDASIIESDIFISIDRVKENAAGGSNTFYNELHRVMIHGILHLVGFDDKSDADTKLMREKENACLSLLKI